MVLLNMKSHLLQVLVDNMFCFSEQPDYTKAAAFTLACNVTLADADGRGGEMSQTRAAPASRNYRAHSNRKVREEGNYR